MVFVVSSYVLGASWNYIMFMEAGSTWHEATEDGVIADLLSEAGNACTYLIYLLSYLYMFTFWHQQTPNFNWQSSCWILFEEPQMFPDGSQWHRYTDIVATCQDQIQLDTISVKQYLNTAFKSFSLQILAMPLCYSARPVSCHAETCPSMMVLQALTDAEVALLWIHIASVCPIRVFKFSHKLSKESVHHSMTMGFGVQVWTKRWILAQMTLLRGTYSGRKT